MKSQITFSTNVYIIYNLDINLKVLMNGIVKSYRHITYTYISNELDSTPDKRDKTESP